MNIIAHRGYWEQSQEQNSEKAFVRAFENRFGIETDIRDHAGEVVIAHDCPTGGEMPLSEFLSLHQEYQSASKSNLQLALNIKADGLTDNVAQALSDAKTQDYFVFDMSVPDALHYTKTGIVTFTRQSEYETHPSFYEEAAGVWLDCFKGTWFDAATIQSHKDNGKKICIVSPELHKRDNYIEEQWQLLLKFKNDQLVSLCTDYPHLAEEYFS